MGDSMESVWHNIEKPHFPSLTGDIKTDVLVIGGGMAGVLCAYMLSKEGVGCVLVEANEILSGITKNTTAKITFQHGSVYQKLIKRFGVDTAQAYFLANRDALNEYERLCKNIDCDFEKCDSFVYSRTNRRKIEDEVKALNTVGCPARFTQRTSLPFSVAGAVQVKNQAQFHPLKFAFAISKNLRIFEHTKVTELMEGCAVTPKGKIRAEKIIVATHFPVLNKHGAYFMKLYQHRSYVLALEKAPRVNAMYVDEDKKGLSFRDWNGHLLLGGGAHRTGKKGGGYGEIVSFAKEHYPYAKEVKRWATQDCMTIDDMPYIGGYGKNTKGLYVIAGFNKWGMTQSMVSANILTDLVQDKKNCYAEVFSPQRSMLHPQLFINAMESTLGILTPSAPRCPHLGCALKYNKEEHSWDCPCHGSRFTESGELIDNPATDDKDFKDSGR